MSLISRKSIDEIFDVVRIDEVVSDYVHLKKRGVNLLGLCPFHNEKTPSFTVSPAKGIYKCFGCGAGGNAINFVMDVEHITYPEALRMLAGKYQVPIEEEFQSDKQKETQSKRESLYVLNEFANKFFQSQLKSGQGKLIGASYLKERNIHPENIEKFQLGYLSDEWSSFTEHATKAGYARNLLEESGLSIFKSERGIDRFRGRVMFPILSLSGKVLGFGGRILKKDVKAAKYLNSPESEVYNKSKVLYGIYWAKQSIVKEDNCLLVEGYTDVIGLHQKGIENVVASSGTALTHDQVRLIKRFTENLTVIYDGDQAGIKASLRGIDIILEYGLNVKVLALPEGEDPDSFSQKHDSDYLKEYIKNEAKDFVEFKIDLYNQSGKPDVIQKAQWIREVVASIAKIPDPLKRTVFIQSAAPKLEVDEKVLFAELDQQLNKKDKEELRQKKRPSFDEEMPPMEVMYPELAGAKVEAKSEVTLVEEELMRILLKYSEICIDVEIEEEGEDGQVEEKIFEVPMSEYLIHAMSEDDLEFTNESYKALYDKVLVLFEEGNHAFAKELLKDRDPNVTRLVAEILSDRHSLHAWEKRDVVVVKEEKKLQRILDQLIARFQLRHIELTVSEIQAKLKKEDLADEERIEAIKQFMMYDNLIKSLHKQLGREC